LKEYYCRKVAGGAARADNDYGDDDHNDSNNNTHNKKICKTIWFNISRP
jgi:hypothetical protein